MKAISATENLAAFFSMQWVDVLGALATPTVACVAVYIAYQQWKTNQNTLKEKLFERRMEVYSSTILFLEMIAHPGNIEPDFAVLEAFNKTRRVASFLFGPDIKDYLLEIRIRSQHEMIRRQRIRYGHEIPPESGAEWEATDGFWLDEQIEQAQKKFSTYLSFENV